MSKASGRHRRTCSSSISSADRITAAHRGAGLRENDVDKPRARLGKAGRSDIDRGECGGSRPRSWRMLTGRTRECDGNAVIDWNENAGAAALAACISPSGDPLHESRMYSMMHLAIHDALNAIRHRSRPYVFDGDVRGRTSAEAAVVAAAHDVLVPALSELPAPFSQTCIAAGAPVVEADYEAHSSGRRPRQVARHRARA